MQLAPVPIAKELWDASPAHGVRDRQRFLRCIKPFTAATTEGA